MCGPWIGKGERERDRESVCVCKLSTHSQEIFSDKEEESGEDKYHIILLIRDILKTELIYRTDTQRMTFWLLRAGGGGWGEG